ncbi:hypothetical protein YYG_02798 [Plasmodium vinckei petteri]|uniref:MORN repeat protein n=1 Tax=Plasmodium vinckei petteri TaxID=138298 RepID=W7AFE7_PLAVN|nr:hypothetical protein YYG_02798 [Plasmodium vinckei petteri]
MYNFIFFNFRIVKNVMIKINKHDLLLKYKDKDDFIFNQLLNIVEYPFNEIFEYADGNIYIGETENKKRHGYGFYIYEDIKAIYQGQWKENSKNGYGILYNKNDVIYSGKLLNSQIVVTILKKIE